MLEKLLFTCNAILPIILVILLGYFIKRKGLFQEGFFKQANKLCFRVCLPVLLFFNIYKVDSISGIKEHFDIILFICIGVLVIFFIGLVLAMTLIKDSKQKGVILQCVFRSNYAIIGIPLAESLATAENVSMVIGIASIVSAVTIPFFNALAIIALSLFVEENGTKPSVKSVIIKILKNPLIIGVFVGIIALFIREFIPINNNGELVFSIKNNLPFLYKTISNVASIASPLALIALGGDFTFKAISKLKKQIIIGVGARCILVPSLCLTTAYLLGLPGLAFPALIAVFGTPVAVSSVPMSLEMGNDDELAGQLVVWTSICSAFSLFVIIFICAQVGIF